MCLAQEAGLGRKQGFVRPVEESVLRFRKYRNARKETKLERETSASHQARQALNTSKSN